MINRNDDLAALARTKDQAEKSIAINFGKMRFMAWALYTVGAGLIAITVWITTVQITLSRHETEIVLNSEARQTNRDMQQALKAGIDSAGEATKRNENSIKALQQKVYGFVP